MVFSDVSRQKKTTQESGQTWGFKFVAKKGVTGPLRDRDGKNRKYAVLVYIQKENPKNRKSYRYGTVTEPWQDHDSPILRQQTACVVHNPVPFK